MSLRKHASTLVLVAVAIALGVYAYKDRAAISDGERRERQTDVFPAYRRQDVSRIELIQAGVKTEFERRTVGDAGDTEWWMTSPRNEQADAAAVDKLLGDIEFAGIVRKIEPGVATFDAPRVTGRLSMGAVVYRFALGGDAPTPKGAAYFHVEGEGAFVVTKDFVTSLLKGPDAYREKTIVPYLSLELGRLEVKGQGADFTLERIDDISFKLPDLGLRASRETLDRVWSALAEARAESFLSDEEAEHALGPDPVTLRMKPKDSAKKAGELLFGAPCPGHPEDIVAMRRAPTRKSACVPKGLLPGLIVTSRELVDTHLFAARGDEVAELTLESIGPSPAPGKKVDIARKGQGWHERAPTDRELSSEETDAANALVSSLMKGQGTNPTTNPSSDPSRDGASFEALARVRVGRGEGKGDEIVELGRPSREGTKVRRLADGATLDVSAALAHRLLPSEIVFRGRQIFPSVLQGKAATALETECEGNAQVLTRGDIGWSYDKPSGFRSDSAIVAELVANLVRTQAESWAADADDGSFGFGDSSTRCSIIVTFDQDGGPHKTGIVFGREAEGGGFYAHVLGEEPVFLAAKSLHDDAGRLLLDRSAFHVDSGDVATLTLSRGKEKLVLLGHDRKLRLADGGGPELGDKLAALLDAMHADSVVHLGPPRPNEGFSRPSLDVRIQTRSDAGLKDVRFVVGDSTMIWKERMFFARLDGVDATFALARDRVSELLNAL